jgi:hypothetical protein
MGMGAYMDASLSGVLIFWKVIIDANITCIYKHMNSLAIVTCQGGLWGGLAPKRSCEIEKPPHEVSFFEPKQSNWGQSRCLHRKWQRQCDHLETMSRSFFMLVVFVTIQACPSSFLSIPCIWPPTIVWPIDCLMVDYGGSSNIIVPSNFGGKKFKFYIYLWYHNLECISHFCIDKTCQKILESLQYCDGSLVLD